MTVDEVITKFTFKADTGKAEKFGKATEKIREGINKTDQAWTRINSKLAAGFQSKWFDQFSGKVTDLRRVQLFLGGIRRGVNMISNVIPGLKGFNNMVTGITQNYGKFTTSMVRVRSTIRSFGTLMGKTVQGIGPMVRSEMTSMANVIKSGVTKALLFIRNLNFSQLWNRLKLGLNRGATFAAAGMKKIFGAFKTGFGKLHQFLLNSNNVFLQRIGGSITKIQNTIGNIKGIRTLGTKIQAMTANVPGLGKLTSAFSAFGVGAVAALAGIVVGIIAVIKAIGALVAKVKKSTQDFIKFEQGMKGVQRVTLASAEDMQKLEEAALKAGEASVFGVKDAADAQRFLAMAGLEVDEVIGALPGTLELAAAAEMDLAQAADIATNIMSSNALQVEDLSRVNDILAFSASNSNQNVAQLGSAIQNIGPAGRLASLSIEDMASWLSILANNGLRGQEAGTMVRNAIMDLVNPTDKMAASLKKGGIELSNFVDATGKIKNINDLMMALQGMSEISRADFLGTLDARTYRALAPIITGNVEEMAAFNKELEGAGGTAAKMAALAFQGLDGAIKEYKSKMETANVAFIKDSGLNELFEEFVRFGSVTLPEIWRSLGLVIKPFVKALAVIMKVLRVIFTFLGGILKVFNRVFKVVLSLMDTGMKPILEAIDQMTEGIKKAFDLMSDLGEGPLQWVKTIFDLIGKIIAGIVKGILFLIGPLLFVVDLLLNLFLIILPNAFNDFFSFMENKLKDSFIGKIGSGIGDFFGGLFDGDNTEESSGLLGTATPSPNVVNSGGNRNASVGKVETNITVQGGNTNEETAGAVAAAVEETIAEQLRRLKEEAE